MSTTPPIPDDFLERVSAWHDGALDGEAARFVAPRVLGDPALRARVARWHAIGDALRGEAQRPVSAALPARVDEAIEALETPRAAPGRPIASWLASAAALALAAVLAWPAGDGGLPADAREAAPAFAAKPSADRAPAPAVRAREALPPLMAATPDSRASSLHVANVPPLVRAPQPTPEQLAPLPAVDAPSRPWPRGAGGGHVFTVDYSVAPMPSPER